MAAEWREVLLQEVADEITVGHVGPMAAEYVSSGIPFLRSQNVEPLRINTEDIKFITQAFHDRLRKSALSPGDVVIVRTGKPGACAVVPASLPVANCSDLVIVRCGQALDARFFAYYVNSVAAHHVNSHLVGAVQQHFNVASARTLALTLPALSEQRAIAHILGTLDDKIELNQRMNETLEAMARAIFKSWFVDATQAGLPKGWHEGKVEELLTLSRETINPSDFPDETFDHYSIPSFDEGRLPKAETGEQIQSNKFLVPPGAVMISKLNPRIPRVWLPNVSAKYRSAASTEFLVAIPKPGISREWVYALFSSEAFLDVFATLVTGTSGSHQRVKPEYLLAMDLEIPPKERIAEYTAVTKPLHARFALNLEESRTLAALRDTLLPKLISGELRVKDAERFSARLV